MGWIKKATSASWLKTLLTLGICLGIAAASLYFVLPHLIRYKLTDIAKKEWGVHLSFEWFHLNKGSVTFNNISLKGKEEYFDYKILADHVTIGYDILWKSSQWSLKLEVDSPYLQITPHPAAQQLNGPRDFTDSFTNLDPILGWRGNLSIETHNGTLVILNGTDPKILQHAFALSLSDHLLHFSVSNTHTSLRETLSCDIELYPKLKLLQLSIDDLSLVEWQPLWHTLIHQGRFLELEKGELSANIHWNSEHEGYEGNASLQNAQGKFFDNSLNAPLIGITFEKGAFLHPLLGATEALITFQKPATLSHTENLSPYWSMRNLTGSITIQKEIHYALKSLFFFNDTPAAQMSAEGTFPVQFGQIPGQEATLHFSIEGAKQHFAFQTSLKTTEDLALAATLHVDNLSAKEYQAFTQLLPAWNPIWEHFQLKEGFLSFDIEGTFGQNGALGKTLILDHLSGKDLAFSLPKLHIDGNVPTLMGQFELHTEGGKVIPWKGSVELNGAQLFWLHSVGTFSQQLEQLQEASLHVAFDEGNLTGGHLEGKLPGLSVQCDLFGLEQETVAALVAKGRVSAIAEFLPSFLVETFQNQSIEWNAKLMRNGGDFFLNSLLKSQQDESLSLELDMDLERVAEDESAHLEWELWGLSLERLHGLYTFQINWLKDHQGPLLLQLVQGTLQSTHLQLNPFSQLLFPNADSAIAGECKLKGDFNNQSMLIHFEIEDFALHTPDFVLTAKQLGRFPSHATLLTAPASFFFYSFTEQVPRSFIPLKEGSYFETESKLLFKDASALIYIWKNHVRLSNIQTVSEGLEFSGEIDIDLQAKESADLMIRTNSIQGSVAQVEAFCRHFPKMADTHFPFKGTVKGGANSLQMRTMYYFDAKRKSPMDWKLDANLLKASVENALGSLSIEDLQAHLTFDSSDQNLNFTEVKGSVTYGQHSLEIRNSSFLCDCQDKVHAQFALHAYERDLQWGFFKGGVTPDLHDDNLLLVNFDEHSHLGPLIFNITQCTLSKEDGLVSFHAQPIAELESLTTTLDEIFETDIFRSLGLKGQLESTLQKEDGVYSVQMEAPGFLVDAKGSLKEWEVSDFSLLDWRWNGSLSLQPEHLALVIESMRYDGPHWKLTASGTTSIEWKEDSPIALNGHLHFDRARYEGRTLIIPDTIDWGFTVQDAVIKNIRLESPQAWTFFVQELNKDTRLPSSLRFSIEPSALGSLYRTLSTLAELKPHPEVEQALSQLKEITPLQGIWDGSLTEWNLRLQEGVYHIFEHPWSIKNSVCQYRNGQMNFSAQTSLQQVLFQVDGTYTWDHQNANSLLIKQLDGSNQQLRCLWQMDDHHRWSVQTLDGQLLGVNLQMRSNAPKTLTGTVRLVSGKQLINLVPKNVIDWMEKWDIESGFSWNGTIDTNGEPSLHGTLYGSQFTLFKNTWDKLTAQLDWNASGILMQFLKVEDGDFSLSIPKIHLWHPQKQSEVWQLETSAIEIKNFQPSSFYSVPNMLKPFIIPQASFSAISGVLGAPNTFKGSGQIRFEKKVKKTFFKSLFTIPGDILGHIGLNPNALSPAMGTLYFQIQNGKVVFTRLDGAYSEGKHSRFYLAKAPLQSYIDFDGQLDIWLRMKQYNLLLKFVESMGIHVSGTWDSPKYSIQKF